MQYQAIMSRHYNDCAKVSRHSKVKQGAETVLKLQEIHTALPCRISQTGLARNGQTAADNKIQYDAKLFCSPEVELQQGDVIEVTRGTVTRWYTAGEPFLYRAHQEIDLLRKDRA